MTSDRIDTDAIRHRWVGNRDVMGICDEVDRLRALAAPVGLTEDEQATVMRIGEKHNWPGGYMQHDFAALLAIIDRLSAGVAEPPHVTHTFRAGDLYGWGCSCGAADDTHETRALAVQGADWHKVHGVAGRCACGFPNRHTNLPCGR